MWVKALAEAKAKGKLTPGQRQTLRTPGNRQVELSLTACLEADNRRRWWAEPVKPMDNRWATQLQWAEAQAR